MCIEDVLVDYRVDHSNRTVSVAKSGVTLRGIGFGTVVLELIVNSGRLHRYGVRQT